MKKQFFIYLFVLLNVTVSAQMFEAGIFIGGSNYIGDVGSTTYINPNSLAFGGVGKFNYSSRITFRGTITYTKLNISNEKVNRPASFSGFPLKYDNSLLEAALGIEFSFFKYNLIRAGHTQTPYIIAEVGVNNYLTRQDDGTNKRKTNFSLPFGVGYKMKLAENIGITFETTFHYTFKDDIDGNNQNFAPARFGNQNSNDWYVFTGVSIVYAFGRGGCYRDFF
jgi:hypothetical protein